MRRRGFNGERLWEGAIMKAIIGLIIITILLCFVAGCGPGEPFEIEGSSPAQGGTTVVAAR